LEIGCLDVANTPMHGIAEQSPSPKDLKLSGRTLVTHYAGIIEKYVQDINALTCYLPVDGYFMKKDFIKPLLKQGLLVITKTRQNANLMRLYNGKEDH